jgi:uncharacterized protein
MPELTDAIRVLKLDLLGKVTWQYEGRILSRMPGKVILEAFFNRPDIPFQDVVFKHNDRFVETFYADRWFNIFEVHDRDDDSVKGWYCNIGRPAILGERSVSYVDLALDLWVSATGVQTVLDVDEFDALNLDPGDRACALSGLDELKRLFESKRPPS